MPTSLLYSLRIAIGPINLKIAGRAIQLLRLTVVLKVLNNVFVVSRSELTALKRTARNLEALALATMTSSIAVRDEFITRFAFEVNDIELVAQISIHDSGIKAILLARWTATILFKPFFKTRIVKDLLAVSALYVFLRDDVEADRADKGVHEFLIRINCILLR